MSSKFLLIAKKLPYKIVLLRPVRSGLNEAKKKRDRLNKRPIFTLKSADELAAGGSSGTDLGRDHVTI